MLKKRIIATLVVKDGVVVQSVGFSRYLPIGKPEIAVEFLNSWGVDEIVLLDIGVSRNGGSPDYEMIRRASAHCRVPLTVGGGVCDTDQISRLMGCGADKISINLAARRNPGFLESAARIFGSQCVVASVDYLFSGSEARVFDYVYGDHTSRSLIELVIQFSDLGAGEILIKSVERDGAYKGFDIGTIEDVCSSVSVPVICSGGAGHPRDFLEVFQQTNVSGAAAGNFFHFTEHCVATTKAFIGDSLNIRREVSFDYRGSNFDSFGRLVKKDEGLLEQMFFTRVEREVI